MHRTRVPIFILTLLIAACAPAAPAETGTSPATQVTIAASQTLTAHASSTSRNTLTWTPTTVAPTITVTPRCDCTRTPSPTVEATKPPTGEHPGAKISGSVTTPNGEGIAGVPIYYAFSAYPGNQFAITDSRGQYDGFLFIPHEEIVRIWAMDAIHTFKPGNGKKSWVNGEFAWHHYGGYENVTLNFIGT